MSSFFPDDESSKRSENKNSESSLFSENKDVDWEMLQEIFIILGAVILAYNEIFTSDNTTSSRSLKENNGSLAREMMPIILFGNILPAALFYGSPYAAFLSFILTPVMAAGGADVVARHTEYTLSQNERMGSALCIAFALQYGPLTIEVILTKVKALLAASVGPVKKNEDTAEIIETSIVRGRPSGPR